MGSHGPPHRSVGILPRSDRFQLFCALFLRWCPREVVKSESWAFASLFAQTNERNLSSFSLFFPKKNKRTQPLGYNLNLTRPSGLGLDALGLTRLLPCVCVMRVRGPNIVLTKPVWSCNGTEVICSWTKRSPLLLPSP
jgi:hypothetical protein